MTRRALAGFVLTVGFLVGSIAMTASWLRATVFAPERTVAVAENLFADPAVKDDLAARLVGPLAEASGDDPTTLAPEVRARLEDASIVALLAETAADIHAAVIGKGEARVVLPPAAATALAGMDPTGSVVNTDVGFEVQPIGPLVRLRELVDGLLAALWLAAIGLIGAGFAMHPRRDLALKRAGRWAIAAAGFALLWTTVIPSVVVPRLTDSPYAKALGRAAFEATAGMRPLLVAVTLAGVGMLVGGMVWTRSIAARRRAVEMDASARAAQWGAQPMPGQYGGVAQPYGQAQPYGYPQPYGVAGRPGVPQPADPPAGPQGFGPSHDRPADGRDPDRPGGFLL